MTVYDLAKYRLAKKTKEAKNQKALELLYENSPDLLEKARKRMAMTPEERAQEDLRWAKKQALEMITGAITLACCQHCETLPRGMGILVESHGVHATPNWWVECCTCKTTGIAGFTPGEAAYHWNLHHMHRLKLNFR